MASVVGTKVIALVGGIADPVTHQLETPPGVELRLFESSRNGGAGELRRIVESLKAGGIDAVWVLVCWIGHSTSKKLCRECRKRGIPCRMFTGLGQVRRALAEL